MICRGMGGKSVPRREGRPAPAGSALPGVPPRQEERGARPMEGQ